MTETSSSPGAKREVYVRMYRALEETDWDKRTYRGLLGDCFLIRIVEDGKPAAAILIDFGILTGSPQANERMERILADIKQVTDGDLDLLVVTHEHWDHISGFSQAEDPFFNGIKVKRFWLAWTENDADPSTRALNMRLGKAAQSLAALSARMKQASERAFAATAEDALNGLEAFLGPLDSTAEAATAEGLGAAAQAKLKARDILGRLKTKVSGEGQVQYLSPGEVVEAPAGMRTYVLGPPRDFAKLFKDQPSTKAPETYLTSPAFESLLFDVANGATPEPARHSPFGGRHHHLRPSIVTKRKLPDGTPARGLSATDRATVTWLKQRYYDDSDSANRDQSRRRVDVDWLGAAGPLAMRLDSDTNNTSLVLAFELPDRSLMLFPGDAQVGNWLSWHDQTYLADDKTHTAADLLARVRFYKVGHHGSHNATLDEQGLALMRHPELVAAISTDEELGKAQGTKGWQMPNPRVKAALLEQTKGRVIRNDRQHGRDQWTSDPDTKDYPFPTEFFDRLDPQNLYIEYRVFGPS